jgi:hypothetical protein
MDQPVTQPAVATPAPTAPQRTSTIHKSRVGLLLTAIVVGIAGGWLANSAFTKSGTQAANEGRSAGAALVAEANAKQITASGKKGYAAGLKAARHTYPPVVRHKTVTRNIPLTALTASVYQEGAIWAAHRTPVKAGACHTATVSNDWAYAVMSFRACPGKKPIPTRTEWFRSSGGAWTSLGQGACQVPQKYRRSFSISYC